MRTLSYNFHRLGFVYVGWSNYNSTGDVLVLLSVVCELCDFQHSYLLYLIFFFSKLEASLRVNKMYGVDLVSNIYLKP